MTISMPLFSLPYVLTSDVTLTVLYDSGGGFFQPTIAAGTYYADGSGGADDLLAALEDALNTALAAASKTGSFSVTEPATGLPGRLTITYAGGGGADLVSFDSISFTSALPASDMGFVLAGGSNTVAATANAVTGTYQRRRIWIPNDYLLSDDKPPVRTVVTQISIGGTPLLDDYGGYHRRLIEIEDIQAARVFDHWRTRADMVAVVDGLDADDAHVSLEKFISDYRSGTSSGGTPPAIRFAPDRDAPATHTSIYIVDREQLGDLSKMAIETNKDPLEYRLELRAVGG